MKVLNAERKVHVTNFRERDALSLYSSVDALPSAEEKADRLPHSDWETLPGLREEKGGPHIEGS